MYPESAVDLNPGVSLILLPFKLRDLEWLTSALSTGEVKTYGKQEIPLCRVYSKCYKKELFSTWDIYCKPKVTLWRN